MRERGFSLIEMVVTVAIVGVLVMILVALQRELVLFDRSTRVDLFTQPNTSAVLHRVRRDVLDARNYVDESYAGYEPGAKILMLDYPPEQKGGEESYVVIWDFSEEGKAKRFEYVDEQKVSEWSTSAGATYEVGAYQMCAPGSGCFGPYFVRLIGTDSKGQMVVDERVAPAVLR